MTTTHDTDTDRTATTRTEPTRTEPTRTATGRLDRGATDAGRAPVVQVEIVLDIICSASYIGYTRFARAAERYRADGGRLDVAFLPFLLDPDATATGEPLLPVLRRKFGDGAVAHARQVADAATADGLHLDYDWVVHTTTLPAHRLLAEAGAQGLAEPMVERLFRAYFTDGLNIADPATLAGLAHEVGVLVDVGEAEGGSAATAVDAGLARVRSLGIHAIPVFRYIDQAPLTGVHSEATLFGALRGSGVVTRQDLFNRPGADR